MVKRIRYGMIGAGHAAQVLHLPQLRRDARVELVWCADTRPQLAAQTAAQFGVAHSGADYERLFDAHPVDAVSICTPHSVHYAATMAAIRRGIHVCCEKPLGMSRAEAQALADAADAAGVRHMVAYTYRFKPAARLMKELIAAGEFGKLVQVHGSYAQALALDGKPMDWRFQKSVAGSGALADLGSHLLQLALWWAGDLRRVCAQFQTVVPARPRAAGGVGAGEPVPVDVEDVCVVTGELISGAAFQLTASRLFFGHKNDQRLEVSGTHGAALYQNTASHLRVCVGRPFRESEAWELASVPQRLVGYGLRRAGRAAWVRIAAPVHCRVDQMRQFIDGILEGHPLEPDFHEGARVYAAMEAIERSARMGEWVEIVAPAGRQPAPAPGAVLQR